MEFISDKKYWCIKNMCPGIVKPWAGTLQICYNITKDVYSMYPVGGIDDGWYPKDCIYVAPEDLFHTKAEAKADYIKLEVARLGREQLRVANEIIELMGYKNGDE